MPGVAHLSKAKSDPIGDFAKKVYQFKYCKILHYNGKNEIEITY